MKDIGMTRKKMTNAILDANGGLDSQRALSTAHNILLSHDLQRPILYHVVITGGDIETYQAVIKKLIRRIRTKCRAEYFGAYEVAENRGGAHAHVFILIETRHNQPFKFMDIREGGYLLKLAKAHNLVKPDGTISPIHISKPKNRMHGGQMFAVPVGDELLADCLKWATYEYKSRSKEGVERREVYFNSEFKANVAKRIEEKAKRVKKSSLPSAPQAEQEAIAVESDYKPLGGDSEPSVWVDAKSTPEPHQGPFSEPERHSNNKGDDMKLTTAQNYLATLYENAVDARMDIDAMRLYLLEQGVRRTPAQLVDELENTFGFLGYASRHVAPAKPDVRMLDALIDRTPLRRKTEQASFGLLSSLVKQVEQAQPFG